MSYALRSCQMLSVYHNEKEDIEENKLAESFEVERRESKMLC